MTLNDTVIRAAETLIFLGVDKDTITERELAEVYATLLMAVGCCAVYLKIGPDTLHRDFVLSVLHGGQRTLEAREKLSKLSKEPAV